VRWRVQGVAERQTAAHVPVTEGSAAGILRQAHDHGYDLGLIANSAMATADFPMIAGPALHGTLMVAAADMRGSPRAAEVVARFQAQGYEPPGFTLYAYAAVQVWARRWRRRARWIWLP
jgi:branched-chain amino acid transport system substrate-binding protein